MKDEMFDKCQELIIPRSYIERLIELSKEIYIFDNQEVSQLKGYIEALGEIYDIEPKKKK